MRVGIARAGITGLWKRGAVETSEWRSAKEHESVGGSDHCAQLDCSAISAIDFGETITGFGPGDAEGGTDGHDARISRRVGKRDPAIASDRGYPPSALGRGDPVLDNPFSRTGRDGLRDALSSCGSGDSGNSRDDIGCDDAGDAVYESRDGCCEDWCGV